MQKKYLLLSLAIIYTTLGFAQGNSKAAINQTLNTWHDAAADTQQESYFNFFTEDAIYIGTDSTEIWTKQQFYDWATPYFEKGKAWSFSVNSRNIYLHEEGCMAWFDELIDYGKGTLRGSGVLVKSAEEWKIKHYVLSLPIPNEKFKAVVEVLHEPMEKIEREE